MMSKYKREIYIVVGLFIITVLTRLPFTSKILYHWDSINMAFGLEHFDVAAGQPQAPGYILFVFLGQAINLFIADAQITLVLISVISSGLAVSFMYLLGKEMFNKKVGLASALFLASSPLFWFYSEIALPHVFDTYIILVAVYLMYRLSGGDEKLLIPTAIWIALAGGFRPQTEVFLSLLVLYVAWYLTWRQRFIALGVLFVVNLFWFVPLLWLHGGPEQYFLILEKYSEAFTNTTSVFAEGGMVGFIRNMRKLTMYTMYGWALALIPFLIWGVILIKKAQLLNKIELLNFMKDHRLWFILCWILPSIAYYAFIHMGQQGLVFVFLPALLIVSALVIYSSNWLKPAYQTYFIAGIIILNSIIFIFAPTYPLGGESPKLLSDATINQRDSHYQASIALVTQNFPPKQTLILSDGWRFPQYYLHDYIFYPYVIGGRWEVVEGQAIVKQEVLDMATFGLTPDDENHFYVVIFDKTMHDFNRSPDRTKFVSLPTGEQISYLELTEQEELALSSAGFQIVQK